MTAQLPTDSPAPGLDADPARTPARVLVNDIVRGFEWRAIVIQAASSPLQRAPSPEGKVSSWALNR